ncbi:MAG: copper resistance protein CopC [Alphaproteobacteria bacterium]|nr:MAG: copper resistance protein CopC [Alphaproteobacteria bacterium]
MSKCPPLFVAATLIAALAAGPAFAQAKLVASTPTASATVAKPGKIILTFSEKVMPNLTSVDLVMTGMPGMADHQPMKMTGFTSAISADGKTLTLLMKRALPSGSYDVRWHAAGADTQRTEGSFAFTVK